MGSGPADGHAVAHLLLVLAAILVATKLFGDLARRCKQPAMLGELLAGVLLGGSMLGLVDPADPTIRALSQIGVAVLLFLTGLRTDGKALLRVGGSAAAVAVAGVALPFASGYIVASAFGVARAAALVCGAALCATSVAISGRALGDAGVLDRDEGRVVLGAALLDDVIGLIILAVLARVVSGGAISIAAIGAHGAVAIGFVHRRCRRRPHRSVGCGCHSRGGSRAAVPSASWRWRSCLVSRGWLKRRDRR